MTETPGLFTEASVYTGDPLNPDLNNPTPPSLIATLTRPDREKRVRALIDQAHHIVDDAIATHALDRELGPVCILFSGGNDSTTLAHLMRGRATHAVHANTTVGIEATRQYVRDTCQAWGLPLIERTPPQTFRELVLENVNGEPRGFPGPGMHWFAYTRLKERALDQVRRDLNLARSRTRFGVFLAGRRRLESERRQDIPLHEADGSIVWASPIAMWSKLDMNTYRLMHPDVPRNEVSDRLHMSGECLCGAFAKPDELEMIGEHYPDVVNEIRALEADARAAGVPEPYCRWGHGEGKRSPSGRLCSTCAAPDTETLW